MSLGGDVGFEQAGAIVLRKSGAVVDDVDGQHVALAADLYLDASLPFLAASVGLDGLGCVLDQVRHRLRQ